MSRPPLMVRDVGGDAAPPSAIDMIRPGQPSPTVPPASEFAGNDDFVTDVNAMFQEAVLASADRQVSYQCTGFAVSKSVCPVWRGLPARSTAFSELCAALIVRVVGDWQQISKMAAELHVNESKLSDLQQSREDMAIAMAEQARDARISELGLDRARKQIQQLEKDLLDTKLRATNTAEKLRQEETARADAEQRLVVAQRELDKLHEGLQESKVTSALVLGGGKALHLTPLLHGWLQRTCTGRGIAASLAACRTEPCRGEGDGGGSEGERVHGCSPAAGPRAVSLSR